jgi:hypothetical protein
MLCPQSTSRARRHWTIRSSLALLLLMAIQLLLSSTHTMVAAWSSAPPSEKNPSSSRRSFFAHLTTQVAVGASVLATNSQSSVALDMDAFAQKELSSEKCDERTDKKCQPKLTEDQALCRFGQPSKETGAACLRAGMPTKGSSGVDRFGQIDRGDYTRCKTKWVDDPKTNKLVKEWNCQ